MIEQPGQAAGTAEPRKPILWSAHDNHSLPSLVEVVDEDGIFVGLIHRTHSERLLACVNFCAHYGTDLLTSVDRQKLRVVIERAPEHVAEAVEAFRRNSEQFHADQASSLTTSRSYPGGLV